MYSECLKLRREGTSTELNSWELGGTALRSKTRRTKLQVLGYFSPNILLPDSKVK